MDQETQQIIDDVAHLKDQLDRFRIVDTKLEQMGVLMAQITDSVINSHASLAKHDLTLDEIRIGADFRKRESENSVREIKSQMNNMERDMETGMSAVVDKVVERIDTFEKNHQRNIADVRNVVKGEIDELKRRVALIERWNAFHLTMLVIVSIVVLLVP